MERVIVVNNAKWATFTIYFMARDDDDDVCFVLDQHTYKLNFYNISPHVNMSLHSDTLSWFEPTSLCSYFLMLHAKGRAAYTNFIVFGMHRAGLIK